MAPTRNAKDDEAQELGQDGQTGMRRDGPGTLVISPTIVVPQPSGSFPPLDPLRLIFMQGLRA